MSGNRSGNRVQINFRGPRALIKLVDEIAQEKGVSRNETLIAAVEFGVEVMTDKIEQERVALASQKAVNDRADVLAESKGAQAKELGEALAEQFGPKAVEQVPDPDGLLNESQSESKHWHRFVKVEGSEGPSKVLGYTEAAFECACGKSKRELIARA